MEEQTFVYLGRKQPCNCALLIMVDRPEYATDNAKEIAKWVRKGGTIERVEIEAGKAALNFDCAHDKKKPTATAQQERFV